MTRPPHRFHVAGPLPEEPGAIVALPEGESRHLLQVLRVATGSRVAVFDSSGRCWLAETRAASGRVAEVVLIEPVEETAPMDSTLHVAVSLLKRSAMDDMIEKLCELNVASIQPLICARTVALPKGEGGETPERWERIALAAAKQSGRNVPLQFHPVAKLDEWLARERPQTLACFAHTAPGSPGLGEWLSGRAGMGFPVQAAIGPEGGWTPEEVAAFEAGGFSAVGLGHLVLRAETAAVAVAAACRIML